jgi:adenosylcobinamide-phosphate synthase
MLSFLFDSLQGMTYLVLALVMVLMLLMALWIDARWGEPRAALHPVVWMGNYLQACGKVSLHRAPWVAYVLGALAWCVGAVLVGVLAYWLETLLVAAIIALLSIRPDASIGVYFVWLLWLLLAFAMSAMLLKTMFSWRMLKAETGAVEAALQHSLQAGRDRLSWLVSRETAQLSESEVRESAIESLAENLNDSVVAPIFWFVLLGLPGAAVYRFANTADAMWGYRSPRWEWAGKWAARADDLLSWLPARLTALVLFAVAWVIPASSQRSALSLAAVVFEARKTPSPNSGWPMATMALALGVSLRKLGVYTLNPSGLEPEMGDTAEAQRLAGVTVCAVGCLAGLGLLGLGLLGSGLFVMTL